MHGKIRFPESAIESLDSIGFQCTHQFANCLQLVLNKSMMLSFCHEKNFKIRQNFACKDTFWTADSSTLFLHLTYTCNNPRSLVICRFVYGSMVQHGCWPVMNIFMAFIVDMHIACRWSCANSIGRRFSWMHQRTFSWYRPIS